MNKALITLSGAFLTLAFAGTAFAAGNGESNCQIVYGGGEICQEKIQFTLDKKVQSPTKGGDFVDNLSVNDSRFQAGNTVTFKIKVTNTGDKKIDRLDVVDTFPQYVTFVSGAGTFNSTNNTLSYTVSNLEKGQSNEQTIVVKLVDGAALPANQGVTCLTNNVVATDNRGIGANDASAFCVEKTVVTSKPTPAVFQNVPVKKIPETGPEMFSLLALVPAGLAGIALRKKSKIN